MIDFIWKSRTNRLYLFSAILATGAFWSLFKLLYPYPNIIFDSYNYARAAAYDWSYNAWPIGYSKILQLFNLFSHSANLLVGIQYVFLEFACLVFFFSWRFLFNPGKFITLVVFILLFGNPILLYCCNYIISDPLFIALSLLWITQLLWVICRPGPYMVFSQALLLAVAFTIRYNALYYPFVTALAFILSRQRLWARITGIALAPALMLAFVFYTSWQVGKGTGTRQFSAFGSWKLANDAIYMYAHVLPDKPAPMPAEFQSLDSTVRDYLSHPAEPVDMLHEDFTSGSYFMYALNAPLVNYMNNLNADHGWPFLNTRRYWAVAPLYGSYGLFLIRKYPGAFARYFLWPNLYRYYSPPGEIFGSAEPFELHEIADGASLRKVLRITTIATKKSAIEWSTQILSVYPNILSRVHIAFLLGLTAFLCFGGYKKTGKPQKYCILLIAALWCCDLVFSVLAAGIVLRYQLFVMVPEMAFALYFIEYVYRNLDRRLPAPVSSN